MGCSWHPRGSNFSTSNINNYLKSKSEYTSRMPFEMFKMFHLILYSRELQYLRLEITKEGVFVRSKPSYLVKTFFVPSRDLIKLMLGLLDLHLDYQDFIFFLYLSYLSKVVLDLFLDEPFNTTKLARLKELYDFLWKITILKTLHYLLVANISLSSPLCQLQVISDLLRTTDFVRMFFLIR